MTFAEGALAAGASGSIAGALLASVASPGLRAPWLVFWGLLGALLAALAFWCFSARATVGTTLWHHEIEGFQAVSYGIGWICAGLFAHFHYCWTRHPRLRGYSRTGKLVTMVVGMLSLTIAFYAAGIPIPPA